MTPQQYESTIHRLGLTQVGAARFLGVDERTSRRYIAGKAVIPPPTAMLLNLMLKYRVTPERARTKFLTSSRAVEQPKRNRHPRILRPRPVHHVRPPIR
jgi:hypothetical protein